jgi:hypothetical protein
MLAGAAYTPDVDGHAFRSSVTPETTGTNWAAGGQTVTVTFSKIDASNRVAVIITDVSVATVTLTDGKHAVLYKAVGSAGTDNLIAYCTFDVALAPTAGTLTIDSDNTNGAFYFTY